MSQFWSPLVHRLTPYVPGEQPKLPDLVKLNTNENPYPPSPHVLAAMQAELGNDAACLRLYPDPSADQLKAALAVVKGKAIRYRLDAPTQTIIVENKGAGEVFGWLRGHVRGVIKIK